MDHCPVCNVKLSKARGNARYASEEVLQYFTDKGCSFHVGDRLCQKCYMKYYNDTQKQNQGAEESSTSLVPPVKRPISPVLSTERSRKQKTTAMVLLEKPQIFKVR